MYAGMLAGEVEGRVMQSWQAKLGRLMEAAASTSGAEPTAGSKYRVNPLTR